MGSRQGLTYSRLHHFAISVLILHLVFSSSHLRILFNAEGRPIAKTVSNSKIGSRPPRCDRKCNACGHCQAIQVPTNPQIRDGHQNYPRNSTTTVSTIFHSRGDDYSNYKPMSWKCKESLPPPYLLLQY
nr:EPIDERMAL PATTERNING FACTOR-like protein 2 [Coffea arabica]XP_027078012.1 EPIDERMAL PATTERNING FACTOR-like protein 2 [Coffea arabica]